jgi:S1-C subfamily serine protease
MSRWLSFCAWLFAAVAAAEQREPPMFAASVFRVEASEASGRSRFGSAVMVDANTVVTNCHTVSRAGAVHVVSASVRWAAHLVRANVERDLCLLNVPGLPGTIAPLGNTTDKYVGDRVVAVGFPAGASLTISRGHIEGLYTYQGGAGRVVQGSAYFTFGKSGGALFDAQGQLIGILTFKCRAGDACHFSVPVEWVMALLDDSSHTAASAAEKPFWQHTGDRQPLFLRAASLFAQGECAALRALTAQWLAQEPANPEALFLDNRSQHCDWLQLLQLPLVEK